ncbi:isochorismatase family protein [Paenibacillus sp. XY044]|uniref:isochorismatase family protein n=1 Tax=Paenibacillus sp. XY044 TaxID=2026089 RepID=UPI000B98C6D6|nr:isochorismatase family protein [Paenibacillus sp. XY044]OZB98843.1 hydrolase [Paenibacillus sp. XY044]
MGELQQREGTLKAEKTALVVIDLQQGIAASGRQAAPHSSTEVIGNASKMVEAFQNKGAFIIFVKVSSMDGRDMLNPDTDTKAAPMQWPEGWDHLLPEFAHVPGAHVITKRQWGAFFGTDLDLQLRRRGIDTIVLCGISTSIGVDTTAREAYQHGYHQVFAEDAMTASTKEEHDYVCGTIFPRIGKVRTAEQIVDMLK